MVEKVRYGCPVDAPILRDHLRYDPESGYLYWRERRQGRRRFGQAGTLDAMNERYIRIGDYLLKATNIIWAMHTDQQVFGPIKRRNGQINDNRIENLELVRAGKWASFEDAAPVTPLGMDFSDALRALKAGKRIARRGWNGEGMWLAINGSPRGDVFASHYLRGETLVKYSYANACEVRVAQTIVLRVSDGSLVFGWSVNPTDMLADDWVVVPE